MSAPQNIVKKIAALLRRAVNGKDHDDESVRIEAGTAQKMADLYMARYNVVVELDALDEGLHNPLVGERIVMFLKERDDSTWAQFLLQKVAPLYWCTNKQLEVDAGWTFYVVGAPGNIEPCAVHFEFLRRKIELIADMVSRRLRDQPKVPGMLIDPRTGSFGRRFGPREHEGVCWGVMEAMLRNLAAKVADRPVQEPPKEGGVGLNVVQLDNLLALPPAGDQVAVRGDEVAVGADFGSERPDDVEAPEPPQWAYMEGMRSVDPGEDSEPPEIAFRPVSALEIPTRLADALSAAEVHTVAQLVRMRPAHVAVIDGVSEYDVVDLVHALADHGLFFPPDWEEVVV